MKLVGKTAIVTGGGRDIGAAAAKKLAAEGANVALSYFESSKGFTNTRIAYGSIKFLLDISFVISWCFVVAFLYRSTLYNLPICIIL